MLTLKVDGCEEKLNIGCRTFVTLDVLLKILETDAQNVTLNGEVVNSIQFAKTDVNGGDILNLSICD